MSAGTGILHSEKKDSLRLDPAVDRHDADVHFVQMWVVPDTERVTPGYERLDIGATLDAGGLVVVASGMRKHAGDRAISIRQEHAGLHAALHAAQLRPGAAAAPAHRAARAPVRGSGLSGARGCGGAGRRGLGSGHRRRRAADGRGVDGAEVLVWEMHATLG